MVSVAGALAFLLAAPWAPWARALAAWMWLGTPLIALPWVPWTIEMRVGRPIEVEELFAGGADLPRALELVEARLQALVDR